VTKPTRPPIEETPGGSGFVVGTRPTDPQILAYVSKDGGSTWNALPSRSLGGIGEYAKRVRWHRGGSGTSLVLKFVCSEPVPLAFLDLQIEALGGSS
jgi:hypothetical protein